MAKRAEPNIAASSTGGVSYMDRGSDLMGEASGELHPGIPASRTSAVRPTSVANSPVKPIIQASSGRRSIVD